MHLFIVLTFLFVRLITGTPLNNVPAMRCNLPTSPYVPYIQSEKSVVIFNSSVENQIGNSNDDTRSVENYINEMLSNKKNTSMTFSDIVPLEISWDAFKKVYGKSYTKTGMEKQHKRAFELNVKLIRSHNSEFKKGHHSFELGLNALADMPEEQYYKYSSTGVRPHIDDTLVHIPQQSVKVEEEFDWEKQGFIGPIRDQSECGSCWSHTTAAMLEFVYRKKTGQMIVLSPQHLIDCATDRGNNGCEGGEPYRSLTFVRDNGIAKEESYEYKGVKGECRDLAETDIVRFNIGKLPYLRIKGGDEIALMRALEEHGPIMVIVYAGNRAFQLYKRGVYSVRDCGENSRHAMLLVGYGYDTIFGPYWRVKNSWGKTAGENGYMRIARFKGNMCGIATYAYRVNITS